MRQYRSPYIRLGIALRLTRRERLAADRFLEAVLVMAERPTPFRARFAANTAFISLMGRDMPTAGNERIDRNPEATAVADRYKSYTPHGRSNFPATAQSGETQPAQRIEVCWRVIIASVGRILTCAVYEGKGVGVELRVGYGADAPLRTEDLRHRRAARKLAKQWLDGIRTTGGAGFTFQSAPTDETVAPQPRSDADFPHRIAHVATWPRSTETPCLTRTSHAKSGTISNSGSG